MRILEKGIDPNLWTEQIYCRDCHARFEIDITDVLSVTSSVSGRKFGDVNCPECNSKQIVDYVPNVVYTRLSEIEKTRKEACKKKGMHPFVRFLALSAFIAPWVLLVFVLLWS